MGETVESSDDYSTTFETMHLYAGATYIVGAKVGPGTLLVDALGVNIGWINNKFNMSCTYDGKTEKNSYDYGNSLLFSVNLPLGTQFVFDNGLMLGFRHRLDFQFGSEFKYTFDSNDEFKYESGSYFGTRDDQQLYLAYNLTVSVGFAFGL